MGRIRPETTGQTTVGRLATALRISGTTVAEVHTDDLLDGWTHFADEDTADRADLLVDGAPTTPHDAEHEYVRLPARL
jgi:hypothetical protein